MEVTLHCPLCGADHAYGLDVARSVSLGMAAGVGSVPKRKRSFVRLFACPVKAAQFEATLTLSETAMERITNLTVRAPGDE
jgi:hypothetical protein